METQPQEELSDSEVQELIHQVHTALPQFGEGYIDIALSCNQNNVEKTIAMLIQNELDDAVFFANTSHTLSNPKKKVRSHIHPRLRNVEKTTPSFFQRVQRQEEEYRKEQEEKQKAELHKLQLQQEEERMAKEIQKLHLQTRIKKEKDDAYYLRQALQSEGVPEEQEDGTNQQEEEEEYKEKTKLLQSTNNRRKKIEEEMKAVRTYNRIVREMEAEDALWEECRNTNKEKNPSDSKSKKNDSHDEQGDDNGDSDEEEVERNEATEKTYHGPDKGKGGRILGPDGKYLPFKKTSKKDTKSHDPKSNHSDDDDDDDDENSDSKATLDDSANLSNQQKRRKNTNKAKIGNHHRKERSSRKNQSGMV